MKKIFLAAVVLMLALMTAFILKRNSLQLVDNVNVVPTTTKSASQFIQCLAEKGVAIYGSSTCPACKNLLSYFKDFGSLDSIYFDCSSSNAKIRQKCSENMQTEYVPETQINGVLIKERVTPEILSEKTGCKL